jgi:hypothetical protein
MCERGAHLPQHPPTSSKENLGFPTFTNMCEGKRLVVSKPASKPASQPASKQPASQPASQQASQPARQPASQPASQASTRTHTRAHTHKRTRARTGTRTHWKTQVPHALGTRTDKFHTPWVLSSCHWQKTNQKDESKGELSFKKTHQRPIGKRIRRRI